MHRWNPSLDADGSTDECARCGSARTALRYNPYMTCSGNVPQSCSGCRLGWGRHMLALGNCCNLEDPRCHTFLCAAPSTFLSSSPDERRSGNARTARHCSHGKHRVDNTRPLSSAHRPNKAYLSNAGMLRRRKYSIFDHLPCCSPQHRCCCSQWHPSSVLAFPQRQRCCCLQRRQ